MHVKQPPLRCENATRGTSGGQRCCENATPGTSGDIVRRLLSYKVYYKALICVPKNLLCGMYEHITDREYRGGSRGQPGHAPSSKRRLIFNITPMAVREKK